LKKHDVVNLSKIAKEQPVKLVVDGNSLIYQLYADSGLDWVNGGEYELFAKFLYEFLNAFKQNDILMTIVFDGIEESSKNDTKIDRSNDKIEHNKKISELYPNTQVGDKKLRITPLLKFISFDIFSKFSNITLIQSPFEADPYIAKISQEIKAFGVITSDSDFMILDTNGFIPCDSIKIEKKEDSFEITVAKKEIKSIATTLHVPTEQDVEKKLLPLLACLLGNDYISPKLLKPFHEFCFSKYRKYSTEKKMENLQTKKLII